MENEALRNAVGGLCSGTSAALVGAPLDTIRVRMQNGQSGYRSSVHCATDTVRRGGGIRALWAGCSPQIVSLSILQSVGFASFAVAIRWIEGKPDADTRTLWRTSSALSLFLGGAASGIPITFVQTPLDRIKTLLQANVGSTSQQSVQGWIRELGRTAPTRGWFAGFWATSWRSLLAGSVFFNVEETQQRALEGLGFVPDAACRFISGGVGGVTTWLCVCPLDTIKSYQQSLPPSAPQHVRSIRHAYTELRATHGFWWGWVGIRPIIARCATTPYARQQQTTALAPPALPPPSLSRLAHIASLSLFCVALRGTLTSGRA